MVDMQARCFSIGCAVCLAHLKFFCVQMCVSQRFGLFEMTSINPGTFHVQLLTAEGRINEGNTPAY